MLSTKIQIYELKLFVSLKFFQSSMCTLTSIKHLSCCQIICSPNNTWYVYLLRQIFICIPCNYSTNNLYLKSVSDYKLFTFSLQKTEKQNKPKQKSKHKQKHNQNFRTELWTLQSTSLQDQTIIVVAARSLIQYSHLGSAESGVPPVALIILAVKWVPPTLLSYTVFHARVIENSGYFYGGYSVSIFPLVLPTLSSASDHT